MITSILHTGVEYIKTIQPSKDTVVISILDNQSKTPRPNFTGFKDSLLLNFKDRCEEDYRTRWYWPDELSENTFKFYTGIANERPCNLSDAYKIIKFFKLHHSDPAPLKLVIHCKSGVGRSAAIAFWLGYKFKIKYSGTDPKGRFFPNPRVIRLINKAYQSI